MADRAPSTSRRALLAGLSATPLIVAPAALAKTALGQELEGLNRSDAIGLTARDPGAHPDAALLAREPELARLHAANEAAYKAYADCEDRAYALALSRGWSDTPDGIEIIAQAKRETRFAKAEAAHTKASNALERALQGFVDIRAATLDGLLLKARYGEDWEIVEESIIADLAALNQARA